MLKMDETAAAAPMTDGNKVDIINDSGSNKYEQCLSLQLDKQQEHQQHDIDRHHNPNKTSPTDEKKRSLSNGCYSRGNSPIATKNTSHPQQQHIPDSKKTGSITASTAEATDTSQDQQISLSADHQQAEDHEADSGEQLSPNSSLRRSSRVSALNAKKKLQQHSTGGGNKEKDIITSTSSTSAAEQISSDLSPQQQQPSTAEQKQQQSAPLIIKKEEQLSLPVQHKTVHQETSPSSTEQKSGTSPEMVQEHTTGGGTEVAAPLVTEECPPGQQQRVNALKRKLLKRRLDGGQSLDQYDCKFGIRLDTQGDVVMMSDGSEISSLDETDVAELKQRYENTQKQEVPEEVRVQRDLQIRELEAALRVEEAKLVMMKKLKQSQQQHALQKQQETLRRLAPGVVQNSAGQAYKPKVAVVNPQSGGGHHHPNAATTNAAATLKMNGTAGHGGGGKKGAGIGQHKSGANAGGDSMGMQSIVGTATAGGGIQLSTLPPQHLQVIQQLYERLSQNPAQMTNLIKTLPPQTGHALTELLKQYAMAQAGAVSGGVSHQGQQHQNATTKAQQSASNSVAAAAPTQAQIDAANKQARELTQQNIAKARQQMRRELDQLITKLPVPKAPPPDLLFVPNGNQPEFAYLLGLDLTVQRVLKDRQMFRKPDFPPYRCEECDTDFTTSWKAICGENEDCHLYCERCVRQAQKRKVCQDYKTLLGRAFQQVKEREKEFERQVGAGKFNVEPVLPTPPPAPPVQVTEKLTKVLQQQNNATAAAAAAALGQAGLKGQAAAALQQLGHQHHQNASPAAALNLSKSVTGALGQTTTTSAANAAMVNAAMKNAASGSLGGQQKMTSAAAKRAAAAVVSSATSSAATNNTAAAAATASPLAALFQQNPMFQQQFATMAALSNSPVLRQLGQMASNPMMMAALSQNPMILQQLFAMALQQQQQQQQQRNQQQQQQQSTAASSTATTSAGHSTSASANVPAGAAAALAQFAQKSKQQQQQQQNTQQRARPSASTVHQQNASTATATTTTSSGGGGTNPQAAQMAALSAALMNSPSNLLQLMNQNQNPQLLNQLSQNPQFRQVMQAYMQQLKTGNMAAGGGGRGDRS